MKNLWKNIKDMPNTQNIIVNLNFLKSMFFFRELYIQNSRTKNKRTVLVNRLAK